MTKTKTSTPQGDKSAVNVGKIDAISELIRKLSPDERALLEDAGYALPRYISGDVTSQPKWGYRCKHCARIGLYFVGDVFIGPEGEELDRPPAGTRFVDLPFVQPELPRLKVNRLRPICQKPACGQPLDHFNGMLKSKYIVNIQTWTEAREAVEQSVRNRRRRVELGGVPREALAEGSSLRDVPDDENAWVDGEQRDKISAIADELGLARKVMPPPGSGS